MTYLVTPLGVELHTLTDEQRTELSAALPAAELVILGAGFPDDVHDQPAAVILRIAGAPMSALLEQLTSAITGAGLTPAETEVISDAEYEAHLFAPTAPG